MEFRCAIIEGTRMLTSGRHLQSSLICHNSRKYPNNYHTLLSSSQEFAVMSRAAGHNMSSLIGFDPCESLNRELESLCSYSVYPCTRQRVEGYVFCLKHILDDKNAPYRQCTYTYPTNGRRCSNATHKKESGGMCEEHTRLAQLMRQKAVRRHKPPQTPESLLVSLAHYAKIEKKITFENCNPSLIELKEETQQVAEDLESEEKPDVTKALDPFLDIDAFRVNTSASRIMDYASESESDQEPYTVSSSWQGQPIDSSDSENIDDEKHDDKLRYAGVYSTEEVAQITKDKLIRLQSLYIEQFQRLQHVLKERKRDYLHTLKKEKETLSSIYNQSKDSPKEQRLYEKLKALNRYHKHNGVEAVLHKKSHDRRAMHTEGMTVRPPPTVKCIFTEGGVKCGEKTIPMSKHCQKHILSDPHQVLYKACGHTNAGFECNEPVLNVFEDTTCVCHRPMPQLVKKLKVEDSRKEAKTKDRVPETECAVVTKRMDEPFNIHVNEDSVKQSNFSTNKTPVEGTIDQEISTRHPGEDEPSERLTISSSHRLLSDAQSSSLMLHADDVTASVSGEMLNSSSKNIHFGDDGIRLPALFGGDYSTDTTDTASEKDPLNTTIDSTAD